MTLEVVSEKPPTGIQALQKKALSGLVWAVLEYGFGMGLRVLSSFILTRLLLPAYFGELMLVTTVIVGINLLSDIGLAPSVIQSNRGDDPVYLNTAWTVQVLRGVGLWIVALALSWPVSVFYRDPNLKYLLPAVACTTLISGFNSTNLMTLARHLGVRRQFLIDGSTSIVSLAVTITWAYVHPSVWAIVGGQLISIVYRLCVSHIPAFAPGIRNSFRWDRDSLHHLVHFGKWILLGTALTFCATQADKIMLGRLISLTLLGIYGLAYQLSDVPRSIISSLGSRVLYPFIAKIVHQPLSEFRAHFLRCRLITLLVAAVLLGLMANGGGPLILHLISYRFHEAAWMVPILTIGLWQTLLYQTTWPVLYSWGKAKYNVFGNAGYCIAIFTGLPLGFHFFGMPGVVTVVAFADFPQYLAIQIGLSRQGLRVWRQDLELTGVFVALLAALYGIARLMHIRQF